MKNVEWLTAGKLFYSFIKKLTKKKILVATELIVDVFAHISS